MNARFMRTRELALAITVVVAAVPYAASRTQAPALPSGPLAFGVFTAEFRADGTFVVQASIEGMGPVRLAGQWSAQRDIIELVGSEAPAGFEFVASGGSTGCLTPGRYRYEVDGTHVRFYLVADACAPRRVLFDSSRWTPAGTVEAVPVRRVTRTAADGRRALPRASDPTGSWPSFRGPGASGVADGQHLADYWNGETGAQILWRTPIPGLAHASPVVWGDRLFVTSAISSRGDATFKPGTYSDGDASDDRSRQRWNLYALDRRSGKILWERTAHDGEPIDKRHIKSTYASSSPATDGRVIVSWFGSHGVHAWTVDGDFLWKVDLGRVDLGPSEIPTVEWGPASSPIIWEDLVILQVDTKTDSFVAALALETGELVWKTERDEAASWSTPTVVTTTAGPELVTNASNYIRGYDPRRGDERWRLRSGSPIAAPTPVFSDGLFVIASGGFGSNRPIHVVRPGARGDLTSKDGDRNSAAVVWSRTGRGPFIPTPLAYRGVPTTACWTPTI